jgi:thioredoxin-like negative regulator of GroEL
MSFSDHFSNAAELLVEEDYSGAVDSFNQALALDSSSVKAFTGRAAAYIKLNKFTEALQVKK